MAKIKGSKTGTIINAKFQGQSKSLFPSLQKTKVVILLSIVGNEFCSGEYLQAILKKAISDFEFITFLIADEVYWNNLCYDFSIKEESIIKEKSRQLGIDFLNKNLEVFISYLQIKNTDHLAFNEKISAINKKSRSEENFEIIFWNEWIEKCPDYKNQYQEISSYFATNPVLKKSIENTADNYAKRHQDINNSYEIIFKRSCRYLTEESAGVIWISAALGYNFIAYPGELIKPFKTSKEFFINDISQSNKDNHHVYAENPTLLANWLEITFQRSHEKKHDEINLLSEQIHSSPINKLDITDISEVMCGVTKGIFSLEINKESKIRLLIDIIIEYQGRSEQIKDIGYKNIEKNYFSAFLKDLQTN